MNGFDYKKNIKKSFALCGKVLSLCNKTKQKAMQQKSFDLTKRQSYIFIAIVVILGLIADSFI